MSALDVISKSLILTPYLTVYFSVVIATDDMVQEILTEDKVIFSAMTSVGITGTPVLWLQH